MRRTRFLLAGVLAFGIAGAHGATFVGPTPYLSQSDSPFVPTGTFHLDDFEDNALNTPGVSASSGSGTPPNPITDSVDADDGVVDGSGKNGHSFFSSPGASGIRFTFDAGVLGSLPTAAGIVWTDGTGDIFFEAFDALGSSLGTLGPEPIASDTITARPTRTASSASTRPAASRRSSSATPPAASRSTICSTGPPCWVPARACRPDRRSRPSTAACPH